MRKLTIWLMGLFFITSLNLANAQTSVSGTVSSADDGSTLPGVSVVIEGTSLGTTTDMDGKFTLSVPDGATALIFSFVGMEKQTIPFTGQSIVNVVLQSSALSLEEVVVTAIGISRAKKELGYNVQTVNADVISGKPNADIVNSLAGRTSGVSITSSAGDAGASTFITIRGAASITGNNQPLFVVNGMPIMSGGGSTGVGGVSTSSRSIDINPEDIESITVLKGGAATALYGVRAANGALIITTKTGKNLTSRKVEFHTSVGFDQVSQLPERQTKYSQGFNNEWRSGYSATFGPAISTLEYDGDADYKWDPFGRLVAKGTGNGMPAQYYDPFEFFQTGMSTNNRLSVSNGNDLGSYYFSFSNLEQDGIVPNNHFGRTTLRLNATSKLSDKVTMGTDFAYTNSVADQIQKGSNVSGIMLGLLRTAATFDNSAGYQFADGTQRNYRNGGGYDNPYWVSNNITYREHINRFTGSGNLNVRFNDMFSLSYTAGIDWFTRRYKNTFAIYSRGAPDGYMDEYMNYAGIFNSDLLLNFQKDINEDLNVKVTVGSNLYSTYSKYLYGDADVLEIEEFYQLSNTATNTVSSGVYNYRTMAVFADVHVAYMNMVYLGITGRNDWSTTMPEDNASAFYPSVSLGFVFTELEALKGNSVLSYGKFRASVARTANIAGAYNTSNYFYGAGAGDGWTSGVNFPYMSNAGFALGRGLGNPDLKHETMDSWEVGADLRLFQNRIGLDVSYFHNTNTDLLMSVPIAASSGFTSVYMNAASMESKGIEISLDATVAKSGDFKWEVFANFTKMSNTVLELADGVDNIVIGGFTVPDVRIVAGEQYGSIFGNDWYRDASGNVLINDDPTDNFRDGYPWTDTRSMVNVGNTLPDWTANITNTLTFKDLSLSFMWDIKKGGQLYNGTAFAMNYFGVHARTETREVYYTPEGTIDFDLTPTENIIVWDGVYGHLDSDGNPVGSGTTNVTPVVLDQSWYRGHGSNFGGGPTISAMEPADWIRLRDITLSYNLPVKNTFIKNAQIYFTGKNLFLYTPYSGIDPETNLQGARNGQGMDYFNNPGAKSFTFGLKVSL